MVCKIDTCHMTDHVGVLIKFYNGGFPSDEVLQYAVSMWPGVVHVVQVVG